MNLLTYEEFKNTPEYQTFIKENSDVGTLKIMAFTAYQAIPIEGVEILITRDFGDNRVIFFSGFTDSSGIIDNIMLPAPASGYNLPIYQSPKFTLYNLSAIKSEYETIREYGIGMLGGIKAIQYVKMIPAVNLGDTDGSGL